MRRLRSALFPAVDPVVAVRRSRAEADACLQALRSAGYGHCMLTVIAERRTDGVGRAIPDEFAARPWLRADSGLLWGLLWAAAAAATVRTVPIGGGASGMLLLAGALALVIQVAIVSRLVAPEHDRPVEAPMTPRLLEDPAASSDWRFVVIVRGARSEIALARTILAHCRSVQAVPSQPVMPGVSA